MQTPDSGSGALPEPQDAQVAYFCMEIGLDAAMPTYSGGLGVLAGDTIRAAADLGVPMVAVTLLYRGGYFRQHLDEQGQQSESPVSWDPDTFLERLDPRVSVSVEGREVQVQAWRYVVTGASGRTVPVYFLDTALPENDTWDQTITDRLYGGDQHYRFVQEVVLGLGGLAMLEALGHSGVRVYHMNEGHSALLTLGLLQRRLEANAGQREVEAALTLVRALCVFTTHTPVSAGHDRFPADLVRGVLNPEVVLLWERTGLARSEDGIFNMTELAMEFSGYVNAVSRRHQLVTNRMFPGNHVHYVTNGVHTAGWTSPEFQELFDSHIPAWRRNNQLLRYANNIPLDEITTAHQRAKKQLLQKVEQRFGARLRPEVLTIGFARRAAVYKRADLLFTDLDVLRKLTQKHGPIQVVFGGKAHPQDEAGKEKIRQVHSAAGELGEDIPVVYLEEYDIELARLFVAGVDVWLNTPLKPMEASGTSGMKAALNGVPSLSVMDGWWLEGHIEGVTGWAIGDESFESSGDDAACLYQALSDSVLPLFYEHPLRFARLMRSAIALNGSFFNTQRMLAHYLAEAYQLD